GKLRIEHEPGHPNDPSYLVIKKNPQSIKAIKVTMTVASCSGDMRVRIGGYTGKDQNDNPVFNSLIVDCEQKRVYGKAVAERHRDGRYVQDLYVLHRNTFKYPMDIVGKKLILTTTFYPGSILYSLNGQEKGLTVSSPRLLPIEATFKGIGTKSTSGSGVIFIDDVYVQTY
ncbi:MAG: hypothetical protein ACLGPL_00700, partial [Acidobacteriota bacterium]